ncbi:MAG: O-antigen ligase family protein [bacterium]
MQEHTSAQQHATLIQQVLFVLVGFMLFFAPLLRGGRHPEALLPLEIAAILILFFTLGWFTFRKQLNWAHISFLLLAICILLIYLIPIPLDTWQALPGRATYLGSVQWLIDNDQSPYLALSIVPEKSTHALLAVLPLFAIFLATISLTQKQQTKLVYWLLIIVGLEAALGLIQYSSKETVWMWFTGKDYTGSAQGTYYNRDHYSAMMLMTLPIVLGLLANSIGGQNHQGKRSFRLNSTLVFSFLALLILLAAIFSRSRAGVGLSMLGIIVTTFAFARHLGGKQTLGVAATFGTIGAGLAVSIGLIPVLNRFANDPGEDERWRIFKHTIEGIKEFFPWGSGPGTFQELYRSFQPAEQPKFWNHAHNDYLELFFDIGIFAIPVILLFFVIYILGWWQLRKIPWNQTRFIKVGSGIGMLLILLHSLVDFNFHTPANAILFCFLTAIFLKPYSKNSA